MKRLLPFALLLVAGLSSGCLERKEKITVQRNGAVQIRLEYSGDPADFDGADVLPLADSAWRARDEQRQKDGDRTETVRTAVRRFAPHEPLPETFAEPGTRDAETALYFPTEVEIERRPDGTYYHFKRTYPARQHARFEFHKRQAEDLYGKMEDVVGQRDFTELTDAERTQVLASLRYVELHRHLDDLYEAAADLPWPQDRLLKLERTLRRHFENGSVEPLVEALSEPQSTERDERINRIADEFIDGARELLAAELTDAGVPDSEVDRFFDQFDTAEQRRAVTEDLVDETWIIELELPGELVAHNATGAEGGLLVWKFDAQAMLDRDLCLMATSRVGRERSQSPAGESKAD